MNVYMYFYSLCSIYNLHSCRKKSSQTMNWDHLNNGFLQKYKISISSWHFVDDKWYRVLMNAIPKSQVFILNRELLININGLRLKSPHYLNKVIKFFKNKIICQELRFLFLSVLTKSPGNIINKYLSTCLTSSSA